MSIVIYLKFCKFVKWRCVVGFSVRVILYDLCEGGGNIRTSGVASYRHYAGKCVHIFFKNIKYDKEKHAHKNRWMCGWFCMLCREAIEYEISTSLFSSRDLGFQNSSGNPLSKWYIHTYISRSSWELKFKHAYLRPLVKPFRMRTCMDML